MALIINAKMPKNCIDCEIAHNGFTFCCAIGDSVKDEGIDERCPILGEIPDKHGRLVDADKILTESGYDPMMFQPKYGGDHRTQYDTLMGYEILGIIENAPTVVEATE